MKYLIELIEEYTHRSNKFLSNHGEKGKQRARFLQDIINRFWLSSIYNNNWKNELQEFLGKYLKCSLSTLDFNRFFDENKSKESARMLLNGGNSNSNSLRSIVKNYMVSDMNLFDDDLGLPFKIAKSLDLCIFSYKIFSQLTYSIDPFFEDYGEGRQQILKDIDPRSKLDYNSTDIVSNNYTFPDFNKQNLYMPIYNWIEVFNIPSSIKNKVKNTYFVRNGRVSLIKTTMQQDIDLYIFTGKTGATANRPFQTQESYLGYVMHHNDSNKVDIVFRGSRAGNSSNAALNALFHSKGNADWVTDMNVYKTNINIPNINTQIKEFYFGEKLSNINVSAGFSLAAFSVRENLKAILQSASNETFSEVNISGHSLGGTLAQLCYLSMKYGEYYNDIKYNKEKLLCYAFSSPPFLEVTSKKLSFREQEIINSQNIMHTFINSDLVRDIDLDKSPNQASINFATKAIGLRHPFVRANMSHIGKVVFRLNSGLVSKIAFPESHSYNQLYDMIHNSFIGDLNEKIGCHCVLTQDISISGLKNLVLSLDEKTRVEYVKSIRFTNFIVALRLISNKVSSELSLKLTKKHFELYEQIMIKVFEYFEKFLKNTQKYRDILKFELTSLINSLKADYNFETVSKYTKAIRVKLIILFFCIDYSKDRQFFID